MEIDEKIDKCILEEERGVANFKYNNVIEEIVEYCNSYSQYLAQRKGFLTHGEMQHAEKTTIKFKVPEEITNKIDFIAKLNLYVFADRYENKTSLMDYYGEGENRVSENVALDENGKIKECTIIAKGLYYKENGCLFTRSLYNNIFHELNHAYVLYNQLKNTGNNANITNTSYLVMHQTSNFADGKIDEYFLPQDMEDIYAKIKYEFLKSINYRLLNYLEFNALVESVYGDLKSFEKEYIINKDIIKDVMKNTQAFIFYAKNKTMNKTFFKMLNNDEKEKVEEIFRMSIYALQYKIDTLLDELLRKIYKVASLFLDSQKDLKEYKGQIILTNY